MAGETKLMSSNNQLSPINKNAAKLRIGGLTPGVLEKISSDDSSLR